MCRTRRPSSFAAFRTPRLPVAANQCSAGRRRADLESARNLNPDSQWRASTARAGIRIEVGEISPSPRSALLSPKRVCLRAWGSLLIGKGQHGQSNVNLILKGRWKVGKSRVPIAGASRLCLRTRTRASGPKRKRPARLGLLFTGLAAIQALSDIIAASNPRRGGFNVFARFDRELPSAHRQFGFSTRGQGVAAEHDRLCSLQKTPNGNWYVGSQTTFDIGPFKAIGLGNYKLSVRNLMAQPMRDLNWQR
jgi:hypothetical protein